MRYWACLSVLLFVAIGCSQAADTDGNIVFTTNRYDKNFTTYLLEDGKIKEIDRRGFRGRFSEDGRKIMLLTLEKSATGFLVFDRSSKQVKKYEIELMPAAADWLSDNKLIFAADRKKGETNLGQPGNLFSFNLDDGSITQLTFFKEPLDIISLDVSPDGRKLIFWRSRYVGNTLEAHHYLFDLDTNKSTEVQAKGFGSGRWSPDGKMVVTASQRGMFIYDAETQKEIRKIELPFYGSDPAFSPDGKQIIFNGTWSGIYVINIDGTGLKTILKPDPRGKNDVSFDWAA